MGPGRGLDGLELVWLVAVFAVLGVFSRLH
jgi:hypothetical protein